MTAEAHRIAVVSGMSGAGRTTALHVLEDLSFYCIDNLPTPLIEPAMRLGADAAAMKRVAIGVDVRVRKFLEGAGSVVAKLREGGQAVSVIFLDAADDALVRRYSESRRPHPLSGEFPEESLQSLIERERDRLGELRGLADRVIDTTGLTVHDLRRTLIDHFTRDTGASLEMTTRVVSFGFKYGVPIDADLMFDARFLPNPHFVPRLKPRTGKDPEVAGFVLETDEGKEFLDAVVELVGPLLPRYAREGKAVLTIAMGCTGGRHRSVALAEALGARLRGDLAPGEVVVAHRDIGKGG
ncbi:MAG: RNase adapter RapZ [Polyangiales bacterium]